MLLEIDGAAGDGRFQGGGGYNFSSEVRRRRGWSSALPAKGVIGLQSRSPTHMRRLQMDLSEGMNMSYTQMMLSIDTLSPPLSQNYFHNNNNTMIEPMGTENNMFMITSQYASSSSMVDDDEEDPEEQPQFADKDEEDKSVETFDNWDWEYNEQQSDETTFDNQDNNPETYIIPQDEEEATKEPSQQEEIVQESIAAIEIEMPEGVEQSTQEDIRIFLEHESIAAAVRCSQEGVGHHVPQMNMVFDTEDDAYNFYNEYAAICGFSIKRVGQYNGNTSKENLHMQ
ncbi:hypothetical protein ACQ4PT_007760 [Festuca glaucescens]